MMRYSVCILFIVALMSPGQDKKDDKAKKPETGSVTGVVTAKGDGWVEIQADDQKRPRRYAAAWIGGTDRDGGRHDPAGVKAINAVQVGARVKLDWVKKDERPRVEKIEAAGGAPPEKKPDATTKPDADKKPETVAPPPREKK